MQRRPRKASRSWPPDTGIAFVRNGRLLVANRGSGEIVSVDVSTGRIAVLAQSLSLSVGVVEMEDGSLVVSQYRGRVTRILSDGSRREIGESFTRSGVGIFADGANAVFVVDNGAGVVRRVA